MDEVIKTPRSSLVAVTIVALGLATAVFTACGSASTATSVQPDTTAATTQATTSSTAAAEAPAATSSTVTTAASSGKAPQGGGMQGADTSSIQNKYLDLAYADASAAQALDIYLPNSGTGPFPVIVAIHGGAFMMGDKADGQLTPMLAGLDRGYAVVSINYRLSSEATFPAQVNDAKAAIRYIRANAAKYNLDPNRIAAWGGSAGGYLAAMLGTSGGASDLEDMSQGNADQSSAVQAVVDWFGPLSFLDMDPQFTASGTGPANHNEASSPESQLLGAALPEVPELVTTADPTTYITADDPPFLIQHGTNDGNVPVEQSINFADALTQVLGSDSVTLKLLEGAGHADQQFMTTENVALVFDWLDANLK
jgi:acetyl esterase/lipase